MPERQLRAGAATSVITPHLGVSLCGSMQDRAAETVHDELHARALVLDNGDTRLALVVLDLIAAGKEWLGAIKHQVSGFTGIPMGHVLISCTHTHSAPTPVNVFQSNAEKDYLDWAGTRVADVVRIAAKRLQPARVGWAVGHEDRVIFNRRYHMKPGTPLPSPFPRVEDKVKMNPGVENPAVERSAGPTDPDVAVLAVQKAARPAGQPLAIFATYGLHYAGGMPGTEVSADYFGAVADRLHGLTGGPRHDPHQPFVGLLANGCFGDINNIDVRKRRHPAHAYHQLDDVAETVARAIHETWRGIAYHDWVPLDALETTLELGVRKPTADEVKQAQAILERAPQGPLRALPEIYARETVQLADWPERYKTPVQVLRVGDLAVCALPGEPFCQTGLDIKAKSPFKPTMMVGMANDYAGYLPTEEQHALSGYETWRAKSSFLEIPAATRLQQAALGLLAAAAKK
jgi:hypothetical protein